MSGGSLRYNQIKILIEDIEELVELNDCTGKDSFGDEISAHYKPETIKRFHEAIHYFKIAKIYAQRIDLLVEGDDSEESFYERLEEELNELQASLYNRT